jgi:hypothetical protein
VLSANLDEEADCRQIISRAARFTLFVARHIVGTIRAKKREVYVRVFTSLCMRKKGVKIQVEKYNIFKTYFYFL